MFAALSMYRNADGNVSTPGDGITDPRFAGPGPSTGPTISAPVIDPRFAPTGGDASGNAFNSLKRIVDQAKAAAAATKPLTTPTAVFTPPVTMVPPKLMFDPTPVTPPAMLAPIADQAPPRVVDPRYAPPITTSINQDTINADTAARIAAGIPLDKKVTGVYGVADNNTYYGPARSVLPGTVQDPRYATPANPLGVRVTTPTVPAVAVTPSGSSVAGSTAGGALNINRAPDVSSPAGGVGAWPTPTAGPVQTLPTNATVATAPKINWLLIVGAVVVFMLIMRRR